MSVERFMLNKNEKQMLKYTFCHNRILEESESNSWILRTSRTIVIFKKIKNYSIVVRKV